MKTQVARNTIASLVAMAVNRVYYSSDKTCLSYNNWRPVQRNKSWAYTRTSREMDGALNEIAFINMTYWGYSKVGMQVAMNDYHANCILK